MATKKQIDAAEAEAREELKRSAAEQGTAFSFTDDTLSAETLNPALESLYAELGIGAAQQEATVHISLLDSDGKGTEANVWRGDPDDYDLESLAKRFGSGQYRVKLYVKIETGQKVLKANKIFAWKLSRDEEAALLAPLTVPIQQMQMQPQQDIAAIVSAVMAQMRPVETVNPMVQLKELAEVMQAMQPKHAPAAVDQMGMMRNTIELISMAKEMAGGGGGGETNSNDLLMAAMKNFAPVFTQVIGQKVAQDAQQAQQAQQLPQAVPPAQLPGAVPVAPITEEQKEMNLKLVSGLSFLCMMAKNGAAHETYAEMVLDNVPPDTLESLMANPDPVAFLGNFHADVLNHRAWFEAVIAECRTILSDATEESAPEEKTA